jgi:class I fructose-bisphosphate aldolase
VKLGLEAGTNAVASTFGVLSNVARSYAHKIPFIVKINHADLMIPGGKPQQLLYGTIKDAWNMGAAGVGATIYFGNEDSRQTIPQIAELFNQAHDLGLFTVLWCYLRNDAFKAVKKGDEKPTDFHLSADGSGQADHIGVTLKADIIKQKLPENNFAFDTIPSFGKSHKKYQEAKQDHPIDLARVQIANAYNGWIPTINSGGESKGNSDLMDAIATAVINKRAGGHGLILGRKAFQKPMNEGVELIHWVQSVYLNSNIQP